MLNTSELSPALRGLLEEYKIQISELSDRAAGLAGALRDAQDKLVKANEELSRLRQEITQRVSDSALSQDA